MTKKYSAKARAAITAVKAAGRLVKTFEPRKRERQKIDRQTKEMIRRIRISDAAKKRHKEKQTRKRGR